MKYDLIFADEAIVSALLSPSLFVIQPLSSSVGHLHMISSAFLFSPFLRCRLLLSVLICMMFAWPRTSPNNL